MFENIKEAIKILKAKPKDYFIHESSYVDEGVVIGTGTKIWHFSHVMSGAKIGYNCTIGQGVFIGNNVVIGDNVKIQNNVSLCEGIIVQDNVFIGSNATFINVGNPRATIPRKNEIKNTLLKTGCSIGANSTIVAGTTIGDYSMVTAGSVVTKNVDTQTVVDGNPAIFKWMVCKCGKSFGTNYVICDTCK